MPTKKFLLAEQKKLFIYLCFVVVDIVPNKIALQVEIKIYND